MKKKMLAILACAAVMLTTTACGKVEPTSGSSDKGSSVTSDNSDKSSDKSSDDSSSSETSTTSSEESDSSSSEPESSTPEADGKFIHGTVNGNVYTSEFLGFKAEVADGWKFKSDAELATQSGINDVSNINFGESLDANGIIYEMMVESGEIANVSITVQNTDITSGGMVLSVEEYIDLTLTVIEDQFKAVGIEDVEAKKSTANFLGKETVCLNTRIRGNGNEAVQNAFLIAKGKYMATVTFTAADDAEMTALLATFKAL